MGILWEKHLRPLFKRRFSNGYYNSCFRDQERNWKRGVLLWRDQRKCSCDLCWWRSDSIKRIFLIKPLDRMLFLWYKWCIFLQKGTCPLPLQSLQRAAVAEKPWRWGKGYHRFLYNRIDLSESSGGTVQILWSTPRTKWFVRGVFIFDFVKTI